MNRQYLFYPPGRSREGAWIEIRLEELGLKQKAGRSREGAWIEMMSAAKRWQNGRRSLP